MEDKQKLEPDQTAVMSVPPKMFATDGTERDPVAVYKFFASKRPERMNQDDATFYLAVNNGLKGWFKSGVVGVKKNLTV